MTYIITLHGEDRRFADWDDVQDEFRLYAEQTVDDCEQEICDGLYFDDPACDLDREPIVDALYDRILHDASKEMTDDRGAAYVTVNPWYAQMQRCTFTFKIKVGSDE